MSSLGERIRYAREQKGYLQGELAKLIEVKSSGVISNWENNLNKPDAEKIVKLCDVLDVSASFLLDYYGKSSFEFSLFEEEHIKKYRSLDGYGRSHVDTILQWEADRMKQLEQIPAAIVELHSGSGGKVHLINYYRSVSAGSGQVIFEDVYADRILMPDIPEYRKAAYAVKVNGKSMEPHYKDGDILLIEPTCKIDVGEIGIFNVDGKAYVKKLGKEKLISLNKGYDDIQLTEDSLCMGRVVGKLL